ncbi:hypothetical protein D9M71_78700 [compost metagenome]
MGALGLDFLHQLRQAGLEVEARYQLHPVVAGLHRLERLAGLGLLEGHAFQHRLAVAQDGFDGAVVGGQGQHGALLRLALAGEVPVEVHEQLRRAAAPTVDGLPVIADCHQAHRLALACQAAMQGLQPLDDLRRNVLELIDQQMTERRQGVGGQAVTLGQHLAQALEGSVEGHQPLLLQQRLEVLPELHQGFDEGAFPHRTGQGTGLQPIDADTDALHETGLHVERLEQRQRGELAGQLEAIQGRLGDTCRLAFVRRGQGRQAQQVVDLLAETRVRGIAILVGLLQQALLGRAQAAGQQWIVQLASAGVVQLFEPARVAQQLLGQGAHGRMEGAHALARLGRVEGELPEGQDLQQLLAQLGAGGIGKGNDRETLRCHAHVAKHEHHPQHQGGGLAGTGASEDAGERGAAEDHRPLLVGRRADHPGGDGLGHPFAHGLQLGIGGLHPRAGVDAVVGRLFRFAGAIAGGGLPVAGDLGLAAIGRLLRPRRGLAQLGCGLSLGAQVFGGSREVTREGAFHGRQHWIDPCNHGKARDSKRFSRKTG